MKLYAFVRTSAYKTFLDSKNLEDTAESFQQFLREIGTHAIAFNRDEDGDYKAVPSGSCVRLYSKMPDQKESIVLEPKTTMPTGPLPVPVPAPLKCCAIM